MMSKKFYHRGSVGPVAPVFCANCRDSVTGRRGDGETGRQREPLVPEHLWLARCDRSIAAAAVHEIALGREDEVVSAVARGWIGQQPRPGLGLACAAPGSVGYVPAQIGDGPGAGARVLGLDRLVRPAVDRCAVALDAEAAAAGVRFGRRGGIVARAVVPCLAAEYHREIERPGAERLGGPVNDVLDAGHPTGRAVAMQERDCRRLARRWVDLAAATKRHVL